MIPFEEDESPDLYMYIVEPTFVQDTDNWEGKIQQIRKLIDKRFN